VLPRSTPALKTILAEREARWSRFERIAAYKISVGKWHRRQLGEKWLNNLSRMYTRNRWRVQYGPVGNQPDLTKGSPNPWAMYRDAERRTGGPGGKGYVSPWEVRQLAQGKTRLEKGLLFVQQVERKARRRGGLNQDRVRQWIVEKDEAINAARGKRKEQLIIERNRLERLL